MVCPATQKPQPFTTAAVICTTSRSDKDYVDAVVRAGGVPLIIPFTTDKEVIVSQTQIIDGLILSGGHDVSPYKLWTRA